MALEQLKELVDHGGKIQGLVDYVAILLRK